jgi:hypothetical protein
MSDCPQLTEARAQALLRGSVPCFEPALSSAYGDGVRAVAPEHAGANQLEDLRAPEIASLLAAAAPLGSMAVHILASLAQRAQQDAGARASLDAALSAGALVALFQRAAAAAGAFERDSEASPSVLTELLTMAEVHPCENRRLFYF